jgi:CubicO group peptidase (beta-lactamase class C family)
MSIQRRDFLKNAALGVAGLSLAPWLSQSLFAAPRAMAMSYSTPEAQGISSESILNFINAAEKNNLGMHSLMIVRNGKNVAQGWWDPYKPDLKHMMYSLSKSFTSTAIGFAVNEGLLKLTDKITDLFAEDLPGRPTTYLYAMEVRHLLTMTTGHDRDTTALMRKDPKVSWTKAFMALPVPQQPGSYFLYNTGATYMLSALITKLTGKTLIEYLTPRLFKPLEITGADWEVSPQGINTGGWGLRVKTEDIAKLGMLYLQNGMWNGKQVLPANWAKEATTYKVSNASLKGKDESSDWQQGYCYQFWRCRHDFFRGDGAMGQYCLVSRDLNTVIAITSEISDMQKTLNHVWDYLLPGIKPATLPADASNQAALKQKLASLTLLPKNTGLGQTTKAQVSGKVFGIKDNTINARQASLTFNQTECVFVLKSDNGEQKLTAGLDKWVYGDTLPFGSNATNPTPQKVVAAGAWTDDKTFVITLQYYETPGSDLLICSFDNNNAISIKFLNGMTAKNGSTKDSRPVLEGTT